MPRSSRKSDVVEAGVAQALEKESKAARIFKALFVLVVALAIVCALDLVKSLIFSPANLAASFAADLLSIGIEGICVAIIGGLILNLIFETRQSAVMRRMVQQTIQSQLKPLHSEIGKLHGDIVRSVSELAPSYIPKVFPASFAPDPAYNRAIQDDMRATNHYHFFGTSGMWTALRMSTLPMNVTKVSIVLPDPDPHGAGYEERVVYELEVAKIGEKSKTYDDVEREWRRRIAQAIAGFYVERRPTVYELKFLQREFTNRFEVFDRAVYVCAFDRKNRDKRPFPETLRFHKKTFNYPLLVDAIASYTAGVPAFMIKKDTSEAEVIGLLQKLQLIKQPSEFSALVREYEAFKSGHVQVVLVA